MAIVERHRRGEVGKRGIDLLARLFGSVVAAMETTREEMRDILGDLFQGGITYGEAGHFLTPEPIARMMARLTVADISAEAARDVKRVCDPTCGSGRMLLGVAELHRHWEFHGQDIDLRCVRMTAINLALRNLTGYVIHGNGLVNECRLVYETGRIWKRSVIRELQFEHAPQSVRTAVESVSSFAPESSDPPQLLPEPDRPPRQLQLF